MASGDIYKLDVVGAVDGQYVVNSFAFKTSAEDGSNPLVIAGDLALEWTTQGQPTWLLCLPSAYVITGIRCKRIATLGGPTYLLPNGSSAGGSSSPMQSPEIGGCLLWVYQPSGTTKWREGRTFMPGCTTLQVSANVLLAGYITALKNFGAAMCTTWVGTHGTYNFGVRYQKPAKGFFQVGEYVVSGGIGTQRKRAVAVLGKPNRSSHKRG